MRLFLSQIALVVLSWGFPRAFTWIGKRNSLAKDWIIAVDAIAITMMVAKSFILSFDKNFIFWNGKSNGRFYVNKAFGWVPIQSKANRILYGKVSSIMEKFDIWTLPCYTVLTVTIRAGHFWPKRSKIDFGGIKDSWTLKIPLMTPTKIKFCIFWCCQQKSEIKF